MTAYDAATGRERWVFRTNGPVRLAPAVQKQSVCFGSDDGHLYCVDLKTGNLRWKHRAVPGDVQAGDRVQTISIQGREVLKGFDILADAKKPMSGIVHEYDDVNVTDGLTLKMSATTGQTLISGIEIVRIP